jgi:hypothetical protein
VPRGDHALVENRMAPGCVGADEYDQVGLVEIPVGAGHGIGAEGAAMAGNRRGHAQPRIGVDVGGAEESLHQLVGDVIVLGEQLSRQVERDRARSVAIDDPTQSARDLAERGIPVGASKRAIRLPQQRMQQSPVERQRFAKGGALRAQSPEVRRMGGITGDRRATLAVGGRQHAAPDAAIGARGAHGLRMRRHRVHAGSRPPG